MTDTSPKHTPHIPKLAIFSLFSLAIFCLAIGIFLTHIANTTPEKYYVQSSTPQIIRTAVILKKSQPEIQYKKFEVKTPAVNMQEDFTPEESHPPLTTIDDKTRKTPEHITRETPFVIDTPSQHPETTQITTNQPETPRWIKNAHPIKVPEGWAKIAIVIDDMGVAEHLSQEVINRLPSAVTLAFLPYGEATKHQSAEAFNQGHDIMVHLPMQPHRVTANPGPNALYVDDSPEELNQKISINFQYLKNISVGVNNHMGSKLTEDLPAMRTVLEHAEKEKLFFMDSVTTNKSMVPAARTGLNIPVLRRNVFLDHEITPEFINSALTKTEKYAKAHGSAIAIGHPYAETTQAIEAWVQTLKEKKIVLVPVSNLLN